MVKTLKEYSLKMKQFIVAVLIVFVNVSVYAGSQKSPIHMFPEAKDGYQRYVVQVPQRNNEHDHRVELLIGKNMMVDCNHHSFSAEIKSVTLKGWGYSYLEVENIQSGPTTMIACTEPKIEQYISIRDELRRYNSRSPMVVYVPKGYEVRYRIWSTEQTVLNASKR